MKDDLSKGEWPKGIILLKLSKEKKRGDHCVVGITGYDNWKTYVPQTRKILQ